MPIAPVLPRKMGVRDHFAKPHQLRAERLVGAEDDTSPSVNVHMSILTVLREEKPKRDTMDVT